MNDNVSIFDNLDDQPTFEQIDLAQSASQKIDVVELSFIGGQEMDWKSLFQGFDRLYAITYSSGITFACNLISMFKYSEVIFGSDEVMTYTMQEIMAYQEKTVERLRETASKTKTDLVNRIDNGTLKLFVARQKLSHEKIYLLESEDGRKRVVMGSANMSYSAFSGKQRENISFIEGENAFDWYKNCFEQLKEYSTDNISVEAIELADETDNADQIPIMKTVKIKKALIISPEKEYRDEVKFGLDIKNLTAKYAPLMPKADKRGKIMLSPDNILLTKRRIIDASAKEKELRQEYPQLVLDAVNLRIQLNNKELDLNPPEEDVKNDVDCFMEYMNGFSRFHGDVEGMQSKYYAFANWFFVSPFMALMRHLAVNYNQALLPYPVFGMVYGKSKAGKTSFLMTLLKMMIGQKPTLSAPDFTRTNIDALKREVKGAPIIVDDLPQQRFLQHGVEIIKNETFGIMEDNTSYPAVVISANEDVKVVAPEIARRTVICHVQAGLTNTELMQSNIVRKVQKNVKTALYRSYLGEMLKRLPDIMENIKDEEAQTPPDILSISSEILFDIITKSYAEQLPSFVRRLTLEDYFSEKITRAELVTSIKKAWSVNRNAFVVDKKIGELRYNAGMSYEADRIMKELPEDLEAHKSREFVIMDLDKACDFFETNFKKGMGLFKFLK